MILHSENTVKNLMLISNSHVHGQGYLDHVEHEIREMLRGVQRIAFVPYALHDRDAYAAKVRQRFERMGIGVDSIHTDSSPGLLVQHAQALFIGGGNTFRLLKALYDYELLEGICNRVEQGMPFIGSSAGSIVACPTLKTTKDMPVVQPPVFDALNLVSFQISPHYLDPDPASTHMGETQEERIMQYLEDNDRPVAGLREGTFLRVNQGSIWLRGSTTARIFRRGEKPVEVSPDTNLSSGVGQAA